MGVGVRKCGVAKWPIPIPDALSPLRLLSPLSPTGICFAAKGKMRSALRGLNARGWNEGHPRQLAGEYTEP